MYKLLTECIVQLLLEHAFCSDRNKSVLIDKWNLVSFIPTSAWSYNQRTENDSAKY